MNKYNVTVYERWVQTWQVTAENKQDALDKALKGDGDEQHFEYVDTVDGESYVEELI